MSTILQRLSQVLDLEAIGSVALSVALVLVATILHELAHAACAYALGDATAKERGRLTLNPFAHLHPVGSVLLPALMALAGGPIFAFAKPVPYNPSRLRHPRIDELLVALAGPLANIFQAAVAALVFRGLLSGQIPWPWAPDAYLMCLQLLATFTYLNLVLCFFNLIPLPPLDGSAVLNLFLVGRGREAYYTLQHYAMPVLFALLYLVPMVLHVNPLSTYLGATAGRLLDVFLGY